MRLLSGRTGRHVPVVAVFLGACAGTPTGTWRPAPPSLIEAHNAAVRRAHADFARALRNHDSTAIGSHFADQAWLIVPSGDTVFGPAGVSRLASWSSRLDFPVIVLDPRVDPCLDGSIITWGAEMSGPPVSAGDSAFNGQLVARWKPRDGGGVALVGAALHRGTASTRNVLSCHREYSIAARQAQRALQFGLDIRPNAGSGSSQAADALRAAGYTYKAPPTTVMGPGSSASPYEPTAAYHAAVSSTLSLRSSAIRALDAQIIVDLPTTVSGFDTSCDRAPCESLERSRHQYMEISRTTAITSLLMEYQSDAWRLRLGPGVLFSRTSESVGIRELSLRARTVRFDETYGSEWSSSYTPTGNASSLSVSPGALVEAAVTLPMSRALLGDIHVRAGAFTQSHAPASGGVSAFAMSNMYLSAGLSVSYGR